MPKYIDVDEILKYEEPAFRDYGEAESLIQGDNHEIQNN